MFVNGGLVITGVANNEVVVVGIIVYDSTNVPTLSGYTRFDDGSARRTTGNITCLYFFIDTWTTGEGTTLTPTVSGNPYTDMMAIGASGVDTSNRIDTGLGVSGFAGNQVASTNPPLPAASTSVTDTLAIAMHGGYGQGLTGDPSTWTVRLADQDTVNDAFTKAVATASSIGGQSTTAGNDSHVWGITALRSTTSSSGSSTNPLSQLIVPPTALHRASRW